MVASRIPFDREICAVCGKDTASGGFMRVYLEGGRLDFCTPACAHVFNQEPERFDPSRRTGVPFDQFGATGRPDE